MRAQSVDKDHADAGFTQRAMKKKFEPGLPCPHRRELSVIIGPLQLGFSQLSFCVRLMGGLTTIKKIYKKKHGRRVCAYRNRKSEDDDKAAQITKGFVYYFALYVQIEAEREGEWNSK